MIEFEEDGSRQVMYASCMVLKKFMPELYPEEIERDIQDI